MERWELFAPGIFSAAILALATLLYVRWVVKKIGLQNLNSAQWVKDNLFKVSLLVGTPVGNVLAPTAEELLFRAPIIVMFPDLGGFAWMGILISAGIFSLLHIKEKNLGIFEVLNAKNGDDSLIEKENQVEKGLDRAERRLRIVFRLAATFILGIIAGYFGIKHQSLWLSIGIHSLWNLTMPLLVPLALLFIVLGFQILGAVLGTLRQKFMKWKEKWDKNEW